MPLDHQMRPPPAQILHIQIEFYGVQAKSKFSQIEQSRPTFQPNFSKNKAWISLDSLVRNEPFQGVIATPPAKKSLFAPSLPVRFAPAAR
jgi:hypothetical protein